MTDKPQIVNLKNLLRLSEFHGVINPDGHVVVPSSELFQRLSLAMDAEHRISPKYIYSILKLNRHSVHEELLQYHGIETAPNISLANSSINSVNNDHVTEFKIDITDVWDQMLPEKVHYRLKSRKQRSDFKLKRNAWTHVIFTAIYNKTKLPCPLAFKSVKMSESGYFATVSGRCSECGCSFSGKIVHPPKEGEKLLMECTIANFYSDIQHVKKRQCMGAEREALGKELVEKNILPCIWRRKRADELMELGDDVPPHLYTHEVVRKVKQQYNDKILGLTTRDIYTNLQVMKYDVKFEGVIHTIGLDPICVHYFTKEQLAIFEQHPSTLYIDATGSVVKKVPLPNGELCSHIYLYQAVGKVGNNTVPIFQMLSSVQNTNAISHWLNEFLRVGVTHKASFPTPKEVITDFDKALLGAVSRVFAQKASLKMYLCCSFDLLTGKTSDVPPCLLRLDICHFMNLVARWKCFAGKPARVTQMYLRAVAVLRKQENLKDLEHVAKAIYTLALSQNKDHGSLSDKARSMLTERIRACDDKSSVDLPEIEELVAENDEEKPMDDTYMSATNVWKWADELYADCLSLIDNETDPDDVNGFYCPEFAKKLKTLLPYFPLFSEVMRTVYNYGSVNATSAAVESEFNDLKNSVFKNIGLPMRIDKFIARHVSSFPGKLKLAMAGQYQHTNLRDLTNRRDSTQNDDYPTCKDNEESKERLECIDFYCDEVSEVSGVDRVKLGLTNTDDSRSICKEAIVELGAEQNWRNKNDRPNKKIKYTETYSEYSKKIPDSAQQTMIDQTTDVKKNNYLETKTVLQLNKKNCDSNKTKKANKYFRYTDPCPDFVSSDAKFTQLPLMVNAHLCPYIRDGRNILIVSNTCGYDSLCQIFGMAASNSDAYREAITNAQSAIFSCVNTLISDGICAKLYRQRADILRNISQLQPELGRNGIIKVNANSTLYNLATYLLEHDPSAVERTECLSCGAQNLRKYPVQTTNYTILSTMGICCLSQAIDESRSGPKLCCGKIPDVELTYGSHLVCEVDNGKSDKIPLRDFPNQITPAHARNYRLAGVIAYEGTRKVKSIGHYIAYVKSDDQWLMYNDTVKNKKAQLDDGLESKITAEMTNCQVHQLKPCISMTGSLESKNTTELTPRRVHQSLRSPIL